MSSIGKRIELFLLDKKISRAEFGRACGTSGATTISNYIEGKSVPNADFIAKAAKNFDISPAWLTTGEGPMLRRSGSTPCQTAVHEPAATDYEQECLRLKHELADKDRELAAIELAMGRQQGRIFEAVVVTCRRLGMPPDQTRILQLAVMDYETILAEADGHESRQAAAGNS